MKWITFRCVRRYLFIESASENNKKACTHSDEFSEMKAEHVQHVMYFFLFRWKSIFVWHHSEWNQTVKKTTKRECIEINEFLKIFRLESAAMTAKSDISATKLRYEQQVYNLQTEISSQQVKWQFLDSWHRFKHTINSILFFFVSETMWTI